MSAKVYCLVGLILYAALSVADWSLTWALIRGSDGAVSEGNPVAAWCLARYGWPGLALFKAGCTATFAGAVGLLVRRQPRAGARMVTLALLALTLVNSYSLGLLAQLRREARAFEVACTAAVAPPVPDIRSAGLENRLDTSRPGLVAASRGQRAGEEVALGGAPADLLPGRIPHLELRPRRGGRKSSGSSLAA
jgi:hypothetical protein